MKADFTLFQHPKFSNSNAPVTEPTNTTIPAILTEIVLLILLRLLHHLHSRMHRGIKIPDLVRELRVLGRIDHRTQCTLHIPEQVLNVVPPTCNPLIIGALLLHSKRPRDERGRVGCVGPEWELFEAISSELLVDNGGERGVRIADAQHGVAALLGREAGLGGQELGGLTTSHVLRKIGGGDGTIRTISC